MLDLQREHCRYTRYFCEENTWWLAKTLAEAGCPLRDLQVLLFSNPAESNLMLNQAAAEPERLAVWDYHVVLQAEIDGRCLILDFDTRLDFPAPCEDYLQRSFPPQSLLPEHLRSWVRRIPASNYLAHFYSDRSHMLDQLPQSQFPPYPIIQPEPGRQRISLAEYRDVHAELLDGSVALPLASAFPQLA